MTLNALKTANLDNALEVLGQGIRDFENFHKSSAIDGIIGEPMAINSLRANDCCLIATNIKIKLFIEDLLLLNPALSARVRNGLFLFDISTSCSKNAILQTRIKSHPAPARLKS